MRNASVVLCLFSVVTGLVACGDNLQGNREPTVSDQNVTTPEDTPVSITVNATDPDGDGDLTLIFSTPEHGTVTQDGRTISYRPDDDFNGTDAIHVEVSDGMYTAEADIAITVTPVNDAPVANDDTLAANEDTAATVTGAALVANDDDVEDDALTVTAVANPSTGTVTLVGDTVTYTPAANFTGSATFEYTVSDGAATDTGQVTVAVGVVNDPPVAMADTLTTAEDTAGTITAAMLVANDTDPEGQTLSVTGVSGATNGTVALNAGTVTFTPALNYFGAATFMYTVSDGAESATGTVNVTVTPVNDTPVANAGSAQTNEDTPVTITLTGSDVEGTNLTFSIVTQPATGTLGAITQVDGTSATVVYTPTAGSNQDDTFTFRVNDGSADSAPATISIDVVGVNDPPVATAGSAMTNEDTAVVITLAGTDPDLDALTFAVAAGPSAGSLGAITQLTPTTASVTYTPNPNSTVDDSFTFTVNDGTVTSAPATVTIDVVPVNDPPVATAGSAQTDEDSPVVITLAGTDAEGDALTFAIATGPASGTLSAITQLTPTTASVTYTPNADSAADDSFTFTANDGNTTSTAATITIDVVPVNDPPVATAGSAQTDEDTPVVITLAGTDVDGNPLTFAIVAGPSAGSVGAITQLTPTTASVTYTPAPNSSVDDSFTFRVNDGTVDSAPATVTVDVVPVDDPPVANAVTTSTNEDTAVTITLSGSDAEGGALTFSIVMNPSTGSLGAITQLTPTTASVVFTPAANSSAGVSFTYRATAGGVDSAPATVSIDVIPVNDPPIAVNDNDTTAQDQAMVRAAAIYAANDTDVDGPGLTIDSVSDAVNGTVDLNAGTITFTPTPGFSGTASFNYNVTDGTDSDTGTVNITVFVNTPPVAVDDTDSTAEDIAMVRLASSYVANDIDPDPQTLTVTAVQNPVNGTVSLAGGTITFTPTSNHTGPASFEYVVSDGVDNDFGLVNITVTPVNDLPVAVDDPLTVAEDSGATPVDVLANDSDVEGPLTVTAVTQPATGGTSDLTGGIVTFQPAANFTGTTSFTYTVTDSDSATATATVNVTVTPVNDAPVANNATATTNEGVAVTVNLVATDVDSPSVTFAIATPPANGTLGAITSTGNFTATVQYTPTGTFFGADSFTFTASDGSLTSAPATANITVNNVSICGDGIIELLETCDDQDTVNGDGCSSTCLVENGWACTGTPSACDEFCGDMIVVGTEQCDDMNGVETDGCTTSCRLAPMCTDVAIAGGDSFAVDAATGHCYVSFNAEMTTWAAASTACDALSADSHLVTITSASEQALVHSIHTGVPWIGATDDGNDLDTVFNWVTGESWGFTAFFAGQPDDDASVDNNGECLAIIDGGGGWGDTNCNFVGFTDGRICELEPLCGNGFVDAGEACDDGNNTSLDGCSNLCTVEAGAQCSGTMPTVCAKLVINEVDWDQPGTGNDSAEFIEIYNAGTGPATLSTYSLVLINGQVTGGPAEYFSFGSTTMRVQFSTAQNSDGMVQTTLAAGQYLVITGNTFGVPTTALRIRGGTTDLIQNGAPDAMGILNNTTMQLVDALSYEGSIASGTISGGIGARDFREGGSGVSISQSGGEASNGTSTGSLQRRPNGRDTDVSANDWYFRGTTTPGAANP